MKLDVKAATSEISVKTLDDIERETALKWAARALAFMKRGDRYTAVELRSEAIEHSSMVEDGGCELTREIKDKLRCIIDDTVDCPEE